MPAYQSGVAEQRERCTSAAHEYVRRLICVPKGGAKCLSAAMAESNNEHDPDTGTRGAEEQGEHGLLAPPWHVRVRAALGVFHVAGAPKLYRPQAALTNGVPLTYINNGGTGKCQQISGGDGYMTEADGNETFMFSFGPLSGLDKIKHGQAGTDATDLSLSDIGTRDALPGCQSELVKKHFGRRIARRQVRKEVVLP
jgi:hypothetical protein